MGEVPAYPGVKLRTFRAPDELWLRGRAAARLRRENWSAVLRALIEDYIAETEEDYGPVRVEDADSPPPRKRRKKRVRSPKDPLFSNRG